MKDLLFSAWSSVPFSRQRFALGRHCSLGSDRFRHRFQERFHDEILGAAGEDPDRARRTRDGFEGRAEHGDRAALVDGWSG
jgi:hypothetical protein